MNTAKVKEEKNECKNPYDPTCMSSLKHWGKPLEDIEQKAMKQEVMVDCGWGRLIFGQTFDNPARLAEAICLEEEGRRDLAMYMRDPQLVISYAPQNLFIDPSWTYRLDYQNYRSDNVTPGGVNIRPLNDSDSEPEINRIYQSRGMVPCYDGFCKTARENRSLRVLVAEETQSGTVIGVITGVDHTAAFDDPDNGSSLWALAVDQQCRLPRVGEALVRELILTFIDEGRRFIDLSVMHTNKEAIALYDKLGFEQVPVYCIKKKNSINEPLFIGPDHKHSLNIYAKIITDEARRRGIGVEVIDAENGYFCLSLGGRSIMCRESLSELTSAVSMSWCDDKEVTRRLLQQEGLLVPEQCTAALGERVAAFLERHKRVVVKPARGEQGQGVFVDLRTEKDVTTAIEKASQWCEKVILERYIEGEDLRIIVINDEVVAAAVRRPASVRGTGTHTVQELIEKQSRRRSAATGGESKIPLDEETRRTVQSHGYKMSDVLPADEEINVRETANLHTGGTIHDVTDDLNPPLCSAALSAAEVLRMPVVGFDFIVPDVTGNEYVIIEANERPGLANHEPQPTAERFVDLLFPQTKHHG